MKFGTVPVGEAVGAILAHTAKTGAAAIRKGTRLGEAEVAALSGAGIGEVTVARLEPGDLHEDEAARRIAAAVAGGGITADAPATGRSNLYAGRSGVLTLDRDRIEALNRLDPAITIATLPPFAPVGAGRMVATVKIIPYGVAEAAVAAAEELARGAPAIALAPFRPLSVGLVATMLPGLKRSVMDKTRRVLDGRLGSAGARVAAERRVPHEPLEIAAAIAELTAGGSDLVVVFGASAVVDSLDVVPAAIAAAGGRVIQVGMPVDPGNLLVLGAVGAVPVVGAPGCARSPRENGFDWVLNRLLAGLEVTAADIAGLGVGGLLMDISSRPQPREASGRPRVAALILAAGRGERMGGPTKMLATIRGVPLVRIAAEAALASTAASVTVVTGHRADEVEEAVQDLAVELVRNPDFDAGISTSIRAGLASLDPGMDGVLIQLADMPDIAGPAIDRLIAAFDPETAPLVVPTVDGRQGNPVLWGRRFFAGLAALSGDRGAKELIARNAALAASVEIGAAAGHDLDTPAALEAAGGRLPA